MPRSAKASPAELQRKSASELLDEAGELHDPVLVRQRTAHDKTSHRPPLGDEPRITQVRQLESPSANDEADDDQESDAFDS